MMRKRDAWTLTFHLNEFTPAEVEAMTGLSTLLQRDWRHRGYGHKYEKHARFDAFRVAEAAFMKMFADQGKGPALSYPHSPKVIFPLLKSALMWREDAWGGGNPEAVFDQIPNNSRQRTNSEQADFTSSYKPKYLSAEQLELARSIPDYEKREWLTDRLFWAFRCMELVRWSEQVIWWPTGEVEVGHYEHKKYRDTSSGAIFDRIDPKYDGPALVLDIEAAAHNLIRRAPRPLISVTVDVNENAIVEHKDSPYDQGVVIVTKGASNTKVASFGE